MLRPSWSSTEEGRCYTLAWGVKKVWYELIWLTNTIVDMTVNYLMCKVKGGGPWV